MQAASLLILLGAATQVSATATDRTAPLTTVELEKHQVCDADLLEPNVEPIPQQFIAMDDSKLKTLPFKRRTKLVEVPKASWIRVAFDREAVLSGRATDFRAKIVSRRDKYSQTLNATTLAQCKSAVEWVSSRECLCPRSGGFHGCQLSHTRRGL